MEDGHAHKMNFIGLTSSRKQSRTNAYTARILLLLFEYSYFTRTRDSYVWPAISLRLCLLLALHARQQRGIAQSCGACRSLRSASVGVKSSGRFSALRENEN